MELSVHDVSVPVLWELGLPAACPNVQKLKLLCSRNVTLKDIKMVCSSYWHLTEVHLEVMRRYVDDVYAWPSIEDPVTLCTALVSSCPQLVKLSLVRLNLGNIKAGDILRGMMVHEHLNSITYVQQDVTYSYMCHV